MPEDFNHKYYAFARQLSPSRMLLLMAAVAREGETGLTARELEACMPRNFCTIQHVHGLLRSMGKKYNGEPGYWFERQTDGRYMTTDMAKDFVACWKGFLEEL